MTNLTLDIRKLFETLPITPYTVVPKRRGRKKKSSLPDPNEHVTDGSILTLELGNQHRGVIIKKKKKKREGKSTDYFRNSVTVVMMVDRKIINFKLSRNGKFQMTGCKTDHQAEQAVLYIWNMIKNDNALYTKDPTPFTATFIPAMRNIDFNLNFIVDREKMDKFFNTETQFHSLLETSIGYTGVNIKVPLAVKIEKLAIKQLSCNNDGIWNEPVFVTYTTYLDTLKPKERQKKIDQERNNTFLVFQSGEVIMSSMCEEFSRDTYYMFTDLIAKNRHKFEEKLT